MNIETSNIFQRKEYFFMENENVLIDENLIERLELRETDDNISILYRPIHNYIHL